MPILSPLIFTILLEEYIFIIIYGMLKISVPRKKMCLYILLCNMFTNPLLNIALWSIPSKNIFTVLTSELIVILAEGILYHLLSDVRTVKSLFLSLLLNVSSFEIGRCFFDFY